MVTIVCPDNGIKSDDVGLGIRAVAVLDVVMTDPAGLVVVKIITTGDSVGVGTCSWESKALGSVVTDPEDFAVVNRLGDFVAVKLCSGAVEVLKMLRTDPRGFIVVNTMTMGDSVGVEPCS